MTRTSAAPPASALLMTRGRIPAAVRVLILLATFQLARLQEPLGAHGYLWLMTGWVVMCALITTRRGELPAIEELLGKRGGPGRRRGADQRAS